MYLKRETAWARQLLGLLLLSLSPHSGHAAETDPTTASISSAHRPTYDFSFAIEADPVSLDPARANGVNEGQLVDNLFEGLVEYGVGDGPVVPGVAERWTQSKNGRVYTFHLRSDARWSDGRPVTASDFRRSWLRLLDPAAEHSQRELLYVIQGAEAYGDGRNQDQDTIGIEVVSPYELRVILIRPAPYFLELCALSPLRPVAPGPSTEHFGPSGAQKLVTNGPFVLDAWSPGRQLILRKNPRYWGRERVRLSWVAVFPIADNAEALQRYRDGQLDWTGTVDLPLKALNTLQKRDDYRQGLAYGTYYLRLNSRHRLLADNRVRRALNLAVDRDTLATLVAGGVKPAVRFVPPTPSYRGGDGRVEWSPTQARTLLKQVAPPAEVSPLTLLINDQPNHRDIAAQLVADWQRVLGLGIRVEAVPWAEYIERIRAGRYDLARAGWLGDYQDPRTFLELWNRNHPHNTGGWADREYDGLLEKARRARSATERAGHLTNAESILLKRGPIIPLFYYARASLLRPRVRGFQQSRMGRYPLKHLAVE